MGHGTNCPKQFIKDPRHIGSRHQMIRWIILLGSLHFSLFFLSHAPEVNALAPTYIKNEDESHGHQSKFTPVKSQLSRMRFTTSNEDVDLSFFAILLRIPPGQPGEH